MSRTAAPLSIDVVNGFIRSLGCNPDRVEEVRITRDHLDIVTTAEDGCSQTTHHRLVESPTAAAVRDAIVTAAGGQRVAVLFNTQAEAAAALRAVYDRRESLLGGVPHIFYLAAGRLAFRNSGGLVDFVNVNGSAYRGQTWDVAYHPFDLSVRATLDITPAVPSGRFIPYGAAA